MSRPQANHRFKQRNHEPAIASMRVLQQNPPKSGHWNSSPQCPLCAKSGHSIATCLYKAECVVRARRRWHLSQITDEIEPSERGRHVLGARKKSERETRKLRCAKPSAPKSSRRRMKPLLDRTKSKADQHRCRSILGNTEAKRKSHYVCSTHKRKQ